MVITESQWVLANDLLRLTRHLGGKCFTHADVERLAQGIARRSWLEAQLNGCIKQETH